MATRKRKSKLTGKRKTKTKKRSLFKRILRWFLLILLLALFIIAVLVGLYTLKLDKQVTSQFEGKRWELPARVYARPLELYAAKHIKADDLEAELKLLHYRKRDSLSQPGDYSRSRSEFSIYTRAFPFPDGPEQSRKIRLRFDSDQISELSSIDQKRTEIPLLRLEPALIANIYPKSNEDRILVRREQVPELLIQTLLAMEDQKFYQHRGVRPTSIVRAMLANLKAGRTIQGGSTLTQQLVKNFFLSNDRTLKRKANEAIMSLLLEWHYDKDEILEVYLNEIFLGQSGKRAIHGFGLASQYYFQRPLKELQIDQIALLVAIVKGASWYDPRRHPERALQRRNLVIDTMVNAGKIASSFAQQVKLKPLDVVEVSPSGVTPFPAFLQLVKKQLKRDYKEEDLNSEGLVIFTTLDPGIQIKAENAVIQRLDALEKSQGLPEGILEAAIVVTSVEQGEVLAIVGGRDPRFPGYNRTLDTRRPIGSLIKPVVYLTALQEMNFNLATLLDDSEFTLELETGNWSPQNYDNEYRGQVKLIDALVHSYNIPTVRLGMQVGTRKIIKNLNLLGVQRKVNSYPSMLLGSVELPPIEVAQIYQSIAANGYRTPLRTILTVVSPRGDKLQRYPLTVEQAVSSDVDYLLQAAMHEVTVNGTARSLQNRLPESLPVAGKTGTTDQLRDSWFAGFSGGHVIVAWVGRDDNQPTGLTGSSGALPIWADIMSDIVTRPLQPVQPDGVEWKLVDRVTGALAGDGCQDTQWLPFITGREPQSQIECQAFGETEGLVDNQKQGGFEWLKNLFQ